MFKNPFQVAIIFAVISLVIKVSIFGMDMQHGNMEKYIWYIYMLLLLCTVFFGIRSNKVMYEGSTTFGQDFRTGARSASFYALLMALITFVYYTKIDSDFFAIKQQPYLDGLYEIAKTKVEAGESKKDIIQGLYSSTVTVKQQLSPQLQSLLTMFGLVFIGLINAAVFALLMKKYPGFKK